MSAISYLSDRYSQYYPLEFSSDVRRLAEQIFTKTMSCHERDQIHKTLQSLPQNERADVVALIQQLITDSMTDHALVQNVNVLASFPQQERADVVALVKQIDDLEIDILSSLSDFPQFPERAEIFKQVKNLVIPHMSTHGVRKIFDALRRIYPGERINIITLAQQLIKERMNGAERAEILDCLSYIPLKERDETLFLAQKLIKENMSGVVQCNILRITHSILSENKFTFNTFLPRLFSALFERRSYLQEDRELAKFLLLKGQIFYSSEEITLKLSQYYTHPGFLDSIIEEIKQEFEANVGQITPFLGVKDLALLVAQYDEYYPFLGHTSGVN